MFARRREAQNMQKTIIVVDDEKDILGLIQKILTFQDYTILPAKNGKEMFEILQTTHPDMILLDIMMPGLDGYEICNRLKNEASTRDIPVVMLTVLTDPRDVQKGKDAGATAYLTKPFEPEDLEREIRTVLGS